MKTPEENEELKQAESPLKRAEVDRVVAGVTEQAVKDELKGAASQHHVLHIMVDGEQYEAEKHEMTPDEIIREYGNKDPVSNYLVQIKGGHKISYQGKGSDQIKLHNGMQFQIISTGPTPVSDGPILTGVNLFIQGLRDLGYSPVTLPEKPDHLVIDYEVQTGRFAGQKVKQGFIVPADFPMTPPSGPHVSPHIHPIKPDGGHPTGAVHHSHSKQFETDTGGEWQYWSRPFPNWAQNNRKSVAVYMSHIWRLWDSQ